MKFLTNHSKIIYYIFGIIIAVTLLLGLFYATAYADVHVYYNPGENGAVVFGANAGGPISGSNNSALYSFFSSTKQTSNAEFVGLYGTSFEPHAQKVFDFQVLLSKTNTNYIIFELVSVICFALLLVLANHSRRVYYKSNLIGGIILPLIVITFNLVLIIKNLNVMGVFSDNSTLFNVVSLLIGDNKAIMSQTNYSSLQGYFTCTSLSFILFTVLFIVVIAYSVFMIIYSILKYKATAEERAEIIKKAVTNND
jgi:hypothetical protein